MKQILLALGIAFVNIAHCQEIELLKPDETNEFYRYVVTIPNNSDSADVFGLLSYIMTACPWGKSLDESAGSYSDGVARLHKEISTEYRKNWRARIGWEEYKIEIRISMDKVEIAYYNYTFRYNKRSYDRTHYPEEDFSRGMTRRLLKRLKQRAESGSKVFLRYVEKYRQGVECY